MPQVSSLEGLPSRVCVVAAASAALFRRCARLSVCGRPSLSYYLLTESGEDLIVQVKPGQTWSDLVSVRLASVKPGGVCRATVVCCRGLLTDLSNHQLLARSVRFAVCLSGCS